MYSKFLLVTLAAAAMFSGANGFTCTRPGASTGYNAPTADPSSLDTTQAPFSSGTVTAGSDGFAATCADGYGGTVIATKCTSDAAYTLSGCTACVKGKKSTGGAVCAACAAGKQQTAVAQASCTACASGKWSDASVAGADSTAGCTSCAKGKKGAGGASATAESSCSACAAGKQNIQLAQSSCTDCASGKWSNAAVASADSTAGCTSCAKGKKGAGGASATAESSCSACAAGKQQTAVAQASCTACASGKWSDATVASADSTAGCTSCAKGKKGAGGATATSATSCSDCAAGKQSIAVAQSSCSDCVAGKWSDATVAKADSTAGCTSCAAGKTVAVGKGVKQADCVNCGIGKFGTGGTACSDCTAGKTSVAGSSASAACTVCAEKGTYASGGACTDCPAGKWSDSTAGVGSCTGCAAGKGTAGKTKQTATAACVACGAGKIAASTGAGCTFCASGKITPNTGKTACTADCKKNGVNYIEYSEDGVNCKPCVTVDDADCGATYTCARKTESRVSKCAAKKYRFVGKVTDDSANPKVVGSSDTCIDACASNYYNNAGTCTKCVQVTNEKTDTARTCSSATDTHVAACASGQKITKGTVAVAAAKGVCAVTGTKDTCTGACGSGTYDKSGVCTACGLNRATCTSATAASADTCLTGFYKDASSACKACPGNAATCSGTTGTTVATCKDTFYKDTTCKPCVKAVDNAKTLKCSTKDASTALSCNDGYYLKEGACVVCVDVTNMLSGSALTCSSATNSQVEACDKGYHKVKGTAASTTCGVTTPQTTDTCVTNCPSGTWLNCANECEACTAIAGATAGQTRCMTKTDQYTNLCMGGYFGDKKNANGQATVCTKCTVVAGATACNPTYTCKSATTSRVSTASKIWPSITTAKCAAKDTTKWTLGKNAVAKTTTTKAVPGTSDTCTAKCAAGKAYDNSNTCTPCSVTNAKAGAVTCKTSSDATTTACNDNFFVAKDKKSCTACKSVANAAKVTCTDATKSTVVTCTGAYFVDGGTKCTACPAVKSPVLAQTCTSLTALVATKCEAGYYLNAGKCVLCKKVAGALATEKATCTDATDSQVTKCAATGTTAMVKGQSTVSAKECAAATSAAAKNWYCGRPTSCTKACPTNQWYIDAANNNLCTACSVTNAKAGAVTCTKSTDATTTACNPGYFVAADKKSCTACTALKTAVKNGAVNSCTSATDSKLYSCTQGYYAKAGACVACVTKGKGFICNAAVTCMSATDASSPSTNGCAPATPFKHVVSMTNSRARLCTAKCYDDQWNNAGTCNYCTSNVANALTVTCTTAKDSKAATCKPGFYADATCKPCTAIAGSEGAITCTTAADSRASACAADTPEKTVGAAGAADTCTKADVTAGSTLNTVSTFGAAIVGVAAAALL